MKFLKLILDIYFAHRKQAAKVSIAQQRQRQTSTRHGSCNRASTQVYRNRRVSVLTIGRVQPWHL